MTRLRRGLALDGSQYSAQGTPKFELLSLASETVRQQRELVQPLVKLRGRFRHRRAGDWSLTRLAPADNGFLDEPGLSVMLREKLRLAVHKLGGTGFERFGDLRVQLLPSAAQQAAMRRVLHQRVLERIDRVGRCASLENQLGSDEAAESGLELILVKSGHGMQQRVGKLASNRRADLRHLPYRR